MGFFSWNCRGCGESMKAPYDLPMGLRWQNDVVIITEDNEVISGDYDGYGRVAGKDLVYEKFECWHKLCHTEQGAPLTFTHTSQHSNDQGYFYDREIT